MGSQKTSVTSEFPVSVYDSDSFANIVTYVTWAGSVRGGEIRLWEGGAVHFGCLSNQSVRPTEPAETLTDDRES